MGLGNIKILRGLWDEIPVRCACSSHDSYSVHVLVLPGVASNLDRGTEAACRTFLLRNVVGVTAASSASDVSLGSASWPKRGRALSHSRSPASAKQNGYLYQPRMPRTSAPAVNLKCMRLAARRRTHEHHVVASHDDCPNLLCIVRVCDIVSVLED